MTDTIFALSSGHPPAGVAVVRMSGPSVRQVLQDISVKVPKGRESVLSQIIHPSTGDLLDEALILWFEGPASYTGEDVAELHLHGGRAVVKAVLETLADFEGLRVAEPGEFTRRAFDAGKLDLTTVEGISDLISADTEHQRKQAIKQASGALYGLCERWRNELIRCRAMIEAELDFSDEEDIPDSVSDVIWSDLDRLHQEFITQIRLSSRSERMKDGLRIVILGRPNAGKSSLLNRLAQRDVAIVTEEAGTTRDILSVDLDLEGYPVTLMDTAGIRETSGVVEKEGIRRAYDQAMLADIVIELIDHTVEPEASIEHSNKLDAPVWKILNKADLGDLEATTGLSTDKQSNKTLLLSAKTGLGIDLLIDEITKFCREYWLGSESALINRSRHQKLLKNASMALGRALENKNQPLEIRAEEIRFACDEIGRISGRVDVEDLLDVIFGEFCVGK
ncbi:MAG: tRNA uridine-5-carboxymethylaminomethyl(34) synthesis GTPase MnmE [Stappiaceae bacterium]